MSSRHQRWMLVAVLVAGAAVRIGFLGRSGLWSDEVFSLAIATGHSLEQPAAAARPELGDFVEADHPVTPADLRRYLTHDSPAESPARVVRAVFLSDTSPPLYYLLLYGWTRAFGTGDITLRLFSVLCSIACFPLLIAIAREVGGRGTVIGSCVLFAFSPLAIYYSIEGRMYSLLWLCVLAMMWASVVLHRRGGSIAVYTVWVVASAAGFLTHYFFLFPWLAIVSYFLVCPGKLARRHLAVCVGLTGLLILPWYAKLPASGDRWRVTQGWLNLAPERFRRLPALLELILQFFSGRAHELWIGHRKFYVVALILFGLVAFIMVKRLRTRLFNSRLMFLWLPFVAACAGPLALDFMRHTYLIAKPRYAIAALPAAYLLAGLGLACLRRRPRIVVLLLIVLAWAPNVLSIYRDRLPWLPMREIAHFASANSLSSDLILVQSIPSGVLAIARYTDGPAAMASWVEQLKTRHVPESLRQLAAGRSRIVFVKVHEVAAPAPEEEWLRANAMLVRESRVKLGLIVDFRPKDSPTF